MERPIPYKGDEKYIFISYAHKDSHLVWPIVRQMQNDGYRVWYDEGIDPGTEWDENIAEHVCGCDYFIAFLSKNYLASENCKDELNYGRDLGKHQLLVYLQPVRLPQGIALRIGRCESVKADPNGRFYKKLYAAEGISRFTSRERVVKEREFPVVPVAAIACVLLVGAILLLALKKPQQPPAETTQETTQAPIETAAQPLPLQHSTLFRDSGLEITLGDIQVSPEGDLTILLDVVNKTGRDAGIQYMDWYINGIERRLSMQQNVSSEKNFTITVTGEAYDLAESLKKPTDIRVLDVKFCPIASDSKEMVLTLYPYGKDYDTQSTYEPGPEDELLLETDEILLYSLSREEANGMWVSSFVAVNKTQEILHVGTRTVLNGPRLNQNYDGNGCILAPGRWAYFAEGVYEWEDNGYIQVYHEKLTVGVTDADYQQISTHEMEFLHNGATEFTYEPWEETGEEILLAEEKDFRVLLVDAMAEGEDSVRLQLWVENKVDTNRFLSARVERFAADPADVYLQNCPPDRNNFCIDTLPYIPKTPGDPLKFTLILESNEHEPIYQIPVELEPFW